MVRAPCCEKMGLKKGPWSPEEDDVLVAYITQHGHANWRALPKQAGLLRCGKSCRLRWTNYLKPDIKRGNFSREEEDTIINLHQMLGNRWSAIAARLPGRTDNEIKNVWHTHLKKKLRGGHHDETSQCSKRHSLVKNSKCEHKTLEASNSSASEENVSSPQQYSSEMSSVINPSTEKLLVAKQEETDYSSEYFPQIDESFWSDELSTKGANSPKAEHANERDCGGELSLKAMEMVVEKGDSKENDESMDFWYNLFTGAGDMPDLPDF